MNASSPSILSRLATAGAITGLSAIAGAIALSSPGRAATLDLFYQLNLDGMTTGTCAQTVCPTPFGTVTVTGDTTSTLDFSVSLSPDVNFFAPSASGTGDSFWFDLSAGGNPITFTLEPPTSGTIGGEAWSWVTPKTGSFTPAPGGDFPGVYADLVQCTNATAGSICGTELHFVASGADATHPFVFGQPRGGGVFADFEVPFVANLSIAPSTALCGEGTACTGLVGAPEPSTWAMMLLGFAGLGFAAFRRAAKSRRVPRTV